MSEIGYTNAWLQFWYVFVALGVGLLSIILFNAITFCYFIRRKPIDPVRLFTDLNDEDESLLQKEEEFIENSIGANPGFEEDENFEENLSPENYDLNQFRMEALEVHNDYRAKHYAPPLQYSEELSQYAQYWAENMAKVNKLVHSPSEWRLKFNGEPLGENVVLTNGFKLGGKGMSDMWYSESYKHSYQELQKETKSYTQMIWASSRKVGFGRAKSEDGKWYGCAHYYPEGNIIGLFRNNVYPLQQL
ncbi:Golgi-associated plant pathogenesis-related 1 [Brachionus plicatilis]|uniref:Golgi-associated plant pathogenesis-related 1 n=1 Tax=Brachionus plicatilis TaxID=10195 RepID=A0A3M7SK49_BRAPC|nr:Golgi-associated plant pathogenesis-related 1 [Brachionus plicatilis]